MLFIRWTSRPRWVLSGCAIMSELLDRSTAVVKRYDGSLSQFTGDGIMAVFGAPVALEDHAVHPSRSPSVYALDRAL